MSEKRVKETKEILPRLLRFRKKSYLNKLGDINIEYLRKFEQKFIDQSRCTRDLQLRCLMTMAVDISKTFNKMTKNDIEDYFFRLTTDEKIKVTPYTKEIKRIIVMKFFKWLYGIDSRYEKPDIVKGLRYNSKAYNKKIEVQDLLTDEEIKRIVEVCENSRDKAIIMLLRDSGGRIGEILSTNIEDFHSDGDICYIYFSKSKTITRNCGLVYSVPYIKNWIEDHPFKYDKKAPLFISFSPRGYGQRLKADSSLYILKKTAEKCGITKNINNRHMRHVSISNDRGKINDYYNRLRHGLKKGSATIEAYSWLDDKQASIEYQKSCGIKNGESEKKIEILKGKICLCGVENPSDNRFCYICKLPLNYEVTDNALDINSIFKTGLGQQIIKEYNILKTQTVILKKFYNCFNGNNVIDMELIGRTFEKFNDDQVLELFGNLESMELIDFDGSKVILSDRDKLINIIKENELLIREV